MQIALPQKPSIILVCLEGLVTWCKECFEHLGLLVWEDQRLIPEAWLVAPLEPSVCSLALLNTARWEGCANPDSLILPYMYLALHRSFHLARCMLLAGPGPGLTNRSQISASHVPQGASLELILASAGPEWWVSVQDCTTCTCWGVWVHVCVIRCTRDCAAHRFSYAARISKNTSTSFVSLEDNNQLLRCSNSFVMQVNHRCRKKQWVFFEASLNQTSRLLTLTPCSPWGPLGPAGQLRGHCCRERETFRVWKVKFYQNRLVRKHLSLDLTWKSALPSSPPINFPGGP